MPLSKIPHSILLKRRQEYAYPLVALTGSLQNPKEIPFDSTFAFDTYLNQLLNSTISEERLLGYLSVIFWGHASGTDGKDRRLRAHSKVRLARDGMVRVVKSKPQRMRGIADLTEAVASGHLDSAVQHLAQDSYADALKALSLLPQLQIAFASKVCALIDPMKCGVIDSVVTVSYPGFGFEVRDEYVTTSALNRQRYRDYCLALQAKAAQLNSDMENAEWTDRDGTRRSWRALDVERALYG